MYPLSFRKKILALKEKKGLSYADLGKRFLIHPRTIQRWKQRIEPKIKREKPATKIDMEALRKDIEKNPDRYQWERAQDYDVSAWAIGRAIRRLGITVKKNPFPTQGQIQKRGRGS
jgi:transposase